MTPISGRLDGISELDNIHHGMVYSLALGHRCCRLPEALRQCHAPHRAGALLPLSRCAICSWTHFSSAAQGVTQAVRQSCQSGMGAVLCYDLCK